MRMGGAIVSITEVGMGIDLENAKSSLLADLYEKSDPIADQLIDDATERR